MITKLQIALFHNTKKGTAAFSAPLFKSITGKTVGGGMLIGTT
jgi:hypothetical protein